MSSIVQELQDITKKKKLEWQKKEKEKNQIEQTNAQLFFDTLVPYFKEVAELGKSYIAFDLYYSLTDGVIGIKFWETTVPISIRYSKTDYYTPIKCKASIDNLDTIFSQQNFCQYQMSNKWATGTAGTFACLFSWDNEHKLSFTGKDDNMKIIIDKNLSAEQTERNKMTAGLRYDILKRDKFRCQICGRSAEDGVKLHVDHIIPISKGGLTEWNNLRTLCQDCNLGKSNKIEDI